MGEGRGRVKRPDWHVRSLVSVHGGGAKQRMIQFMGAGAPPPLLLRI